MPAEVVERVVQKMAEGDDDQDAAKRDERVARAQAEDEERAGHKFHERNGDTNRPKRPDRKERIGERQKIFSGVLERAELKNFHEAGHEEDEAENEAGEENGERAIQIFIHRLRRSSQIEDQSGRQELDQKSERYLERHLKPQVAIFGEGCFQFADARGVGDLQIENARADGESCSQFILIERFREVIIRSSFETFHDPFFAAACGQQQNINHFVALADAPADFGSFKTGHHPIENCEHRLALCAQNFHGFAAIVRHDDVVTPFA